MTNAHCDSTNGTNRDASPPAGPSRVFVPVGRGRALARASVWLAPALVHGLFSWHLWFNLRLGEPGGPSTIVKVAIIAALIPFGLAGIAMVVWGLRWLLLAMWPGRVGVTADTHALRLELGPFGNRTYDTDRLDVRYFFELSADSGEEGFEALLPEAEQIRNFLPRLLHPDAKNPLQRSIMRFADGTESSVAQALRPIIAQWRKEHSTPGHSIGVEA